MIVIQCLCEHVGVRGIFT